MKLSDDKKASGQVKAVEKNQSSQKRKVKQVKDMPLVFKSIRWEGENTLSFFLRKTVFQAAQKVVGSSLRLDFDSVKIEHPTNENYGDYSTNIAMILAGRLKMKPSELAGKLADELNNYIRTYQSRASLPDSLYHQDGKNLKKTAKIDPKAFGEVVETALVAGSGFVNLTIRKDYLITLLGRVLDLNKAVRSSNSDTKKYKQIFTDTGLPMRGKKVMIEFAHPNTHKEFHIGHLRNISIGESLVRTLEGTGARLFRANYEGDVGLHVAKAIWGVRKKMTNDKLQITNLRELNPANKAKFLGEGYALGSKVYDENESVKKEIIELNKAIFRDPKKVDLWEETRRWSLEYFDTVYRRLGSHFDRYFFESEVEGRGKQMVIDGIGKGIFIKDRDGSIYFPGEKYGLNNCVFVTRENYATYEGKDVAIESFEYEIFPFDTDIHVVAHEQRNFFQIAFKALELLSPNQKGRQYHLAYGMVNLKSGKLSSRTGEIITADWLIDQAKEKIVSIIKESTRQNNYKLSKDEIEDIAEKTAVAAVKYSMLRVNPRMDIAFDLSESVAFDGDSGPYLLYTYARCRSVIRKANDLNSKLKTQNSKLNTLDLETGDARGRTRKLEYNEEELSLLRTFYRFPEVVVESAKNLSPNLICTFLFDLAQKYNLFYNKHSILDPNNIQHSTFNKSDSPQLTTEFRLALTQATAKIIQQGLYLLGIETVERM